VEYKEEYIDVVQGMEITRYKIKTKTFPEGVVYFGQGCWPKIDVLKKNLSFDFALLFIPMEKAKEKVKNLDIPLDCPDNGEPIPSSIPGLKNDIGYPLSEGGYIVIELPKLTSREDRLRALPGAVTGYLPGEDAWEKQKEFIRLINEERKNLGLKGSYKVFKEPLNER
ncbi:MAG: hypothetical protein AB1480_18055, partial [Nitrospirota bacterium]